VFWTPPTLVAPNEVDEINSAATYGFVFDFCGVEIDGSTGETGFSGAFSDTALIEAKIVEERARNTGQLQRFSD
jgi:hypothetical protein